MKKKFGLLALTGVIALASCSQLPAQSPVTFSGPGWIGVMAGQVTPIQ